MVRITLRCTLFALAVTMLLPACSSHRLDTGFHAHHASRGNGPHTRARPALSNDIEVRIVDGHTLRVHAFNADIREVLHAVAEKSGRVIVVGRQVRGKVTIDLYGVGFYDAMDAIVDPYGFRYREDGDVIFVQSTWQIARR